MTTRTPQSCVVCGAPAACVVASETIPTQEIPYCAAHSPYRVGRKIAREWVARQLD